MEQIQAPDVHAHAVPLALLQWLADQGLADSSEVEKGIESFLIGTWAEYVRQRENRLTGADRRFEEQARRYAIGEPVVAHLFPPRNGPTKR